MAHIQAILAAALLTLAAVSGSETTLELSTTTGDTVNIPCLFGEGTIRNIFWYYYNNGTERHDILSFAKGKLTLGAEYADRASLQDDNSTLILKHITVVDVGTYCCDVDRKGQIPKQNINTKLNVFSLRPDTLPVIPSCTGADESSSCSIHDNQPFTLNCTLPNVYPVEDTELIWYHDRKHFPSIPEVTQNDDGTTDIIRQIKIYETGNFTCNATYLSANGRENTAVSVEARIIIIPAIIPPTGTTDEPNTPDKNLADGAIVGIAISIVIVLIVGILLCIHCWKTRIESSTLLSTSTVPQGESLISLEQIRVTEKQLRKLAGCLPAEYSKDVAINLGVSSIEHENTQLQNPSIKDATFKMLKKWEMTAGGGKMSDLDEALEEAKCGGIEYKDV